MMAVASGDFPFIAGGHSESEFVKLYGSGCGCGVGSSGRKALPCFVIATEFAGEPAAEVSGLDPAEVAGWGSSTAGVYCRVWESELAESC